MNTEAVIRKCATLVGIVSLSCLLSGQTPAQAVPTEPTAAILNALRSHQVVGLGLGEHNSEQGHAFLLSLVRHTDFPSTEADLVVECGNARYQDVMDRFVAGEDVAYDSLRRTWEDTTQPHAGCDVPLHEELYRAVRTVNAGLPARLRTRVLLGDPPVDWNSADGKQERIKSMAMRDSYPAQVIQQEALAKGRRALVVYGQMHLQRKQMASNYDMSHPLAQTIVSLLEAQGIKVFTVWGNSRADLQTVQTNISSWPQPSLTVVRGTVLGATEFEFFYGLPMPRMSTKDGKLSPLSRDEWRRMPMQDQFDALLYLGPPAAMTVADLPTSLCADAEYMKMRLERLKAYGPNGEAERMRKRCAEPLK